MEARLEADSLIANSKRALATRKAQYDTEINTKVPPPTMARTSLSYPGTAPLPP